MSKGFKHISEISAVEYDDGAYRRGFHQGYNAACDIMAMLVREGVHPRIILSTLAQFDSAVSEWRRDRDGMDAPPDFNEWRTKS